MHIIILKFGGRLILHGIAKITKFTIYMSVLILTLHYITYLHVHYITVHAHSHVWFNLWHTYLPCCSTFSSTSPSFLSLYTMQEASLVAVSIWTAVELPTTAPSLNRLHSSCFSKLFHMQCVSTSSLLV